MCGAPRGKVRELSDRFWGERYDLLAMQLSVWIAGGYIYSWSVTKLEDLDVNWDVNSCYNTNIIMLDNWLVWLSEDRRTRIRRFLWILNWLYCNVYEWMIRRVAVAGVVNKLSNRIEELSFCLPRTSATIWCPWPGLRSGGICGEMDNVRKRTKEYGQYPEYSNFFSTKRADDRFEDRPRREPTHVKWGGQDGRREPDSGIGYTQDHRTRWKDDGWVEPTHFPEYSTADGS